MYTLGIDIGSTTSKCVILKNGETIVAMSLIGAGTGTGGAKEALDDVIGKAGLKQEEIAHITATGYGRQSVEEADDDMSELSCHALGAQYLFPSAKTVIDIGGQDTKVLAIQNGSLVGFQMNDKCAAGTGRFIEVMARVLRMDVDNMAEAGLASKKNVSISSTCTVFAESEVISQLTKGEQVSDIVAGIHRSVASKVVGLAQRVGVREPVVMTGGVSRNKDVVQKLEEMLNCKVETSSLSQYAGALGAALKAYKKACIKEK